MNREQKQVTVGSNKHVKLKQQFKVMNVKNRVGNG